MSLLDTAREQVIVYPAESYTDTDGNLMWRPSLTGVTMKAVVQPLPQSGTSARRSEQDDEGYFTEQLYRLRFRRNEDIGLTSQAVIEWRGERWAINGEPNRYNGSRRTAHIDYTIKRN